MEADLPISHYLLDYPITLDTTNGVFNANTKTQNEAILYLISVGPRLQGLLRPCR
jgi:hypothetical protein